MSLLWDGEKSLRDGVATWVSNVGAPPVLALLAAVLLGVHSTADGRWVWVATFIAAAILLPSLYIVIQVWRGAISDLHVPLREQRTRPYMVSLASATAVWAGFALSGAPVEFQALAAANLVQSVLLFMITLRWKVSLHSAAAGSLSALSLTALGVSLMSTAGVLVVASVPIISWARVRLHRHTPAQTLVGAALGSVVTVAAVWVIM